MNLKLIFLNSDVIKIKKEKEEILFYRVITNGMYRANTKLKMPTKRWYFLMLIASQNGITTNTDALDFFQTKKMELVKQQKCNVSRFLKKAFNIDYDPIVFNRKNNQYESCISFEISNDFDIKKSLEFAQKIMNEGE